MRRSAPWILIALLTAAVAGLSFQLWRITNQVAVLQAEAAHATATLKQTQRRGAELTAQLAAAKATKLASDAAACTIKEAQRSLAAMIRTAERGEVATITRHDRPVAYVIGGERMGAILETMEILANPKAMRAIRAAESGKGKSVPATSLLD